MNIIQKLIKIIKNPSKLIEYLKSRVHEKYKLFLYSYSNTEIVFGVNMAIWKRNLIEKYYPDKKNYLYSY